MCPIVSSSLSRHLGHNFFGEALKIVQLFRLAGAGHIEDEFPHALLLIGEQILDDVTGCARQRTRAVVVKCTWVFGAICMVAGSRSRSS